MSRWIHDAGDCLNGCTYCIEDSRRVRPPTPEELAEMRAVLASSPRPKPRTPQPKTLTDVESAAIARKRLDDQQRRMP